MLFLSTAEPESRCIPGVFSGVELRLDLFSCIDVESIQNLLKSSSCAFLFTLRKKTQGGLFSGCESKREFLIKQLLALQPAFVDLEYDMRAEFIREIAVDYPQTQLILSYHNFQQVPTDLHTIYKEMQAYPAFTYKIAGMAHSTNEALKMLLFAKKHPTVSIICMGGSNEFARVLGPVVGNVVNYASMGVCKQTAPGQLAVDTLLSVYNYEALNSQTAIYGLIGDPVENSIGHLYHNDVFKKNNLNAVYVKMVVKPHELAEFIQLAKELSIQGLSVTAPLKEAILPFVDEIDEAAKCIGAVNTLRFDNGKIRGTNTDGAGALDAIEKKVLVGGKKVVIIGAGGAARGIAFEAKARGADVMVVNRTIERAVRLAQDLECLGGSLEDIPNNYDILINCSSVSVPVDLGMIQSTAVVMDARYGPKESVLLKKASSLGCQVVYGEEMFLNQAVRQISFWAER